MNKRHFIIPIFVPHKGCPHDCIFCNQKKITGQIDEISDREIIKVIDSHLETIEKIPKESRDVEIAFYGGSFTAIPQHEQLKYLQIGYSYVCLGKVDHIRVSTRPDCINDEIINNLKRYGVTTVELGVQSMDPEVLKISNRGHSVKDVEYAVAKLKAAGFITGVQVMAGLPGDTREKCRNTVQKLTALEPDIARIYPTLTIKDTEMAQMYCKGEYTPFLLDEAVDICKDMLVIFESAGVHVIRIGLQATENMVLGRDVIAGPYHPAFRELVEAAIFRDMLELMLEQIELKSKHISISINPKDTSVCIGQKKTNIFYIQNKFSLDKISIIQDNAVAKGSIVLKCHENKQIMSRKDYYNMSPIRRNLD